MITRAIVAASLLSLALPGAAEVYRCEIDGVVTFSDRPCGEEATRHTEGGSVSFIAPDENLEAMGEAAQAYIRERREQLARRNKAPAASAAAPEQPPQRLKSAFGPWPVLSRLEALERGALDQRVGNGERPANPSQERYSPLNGPILGTRRDSAAFERRNDTNRRENNPRRDQ